MAAFAAVAGCGLGAGEASPGDAVLTVTLDYGSQPMVEATESAPPSSETVLRMLDREAEITTRYGGAFVQSIDGVEGTSEGSRRSDWFFYVNGLWSDVGAAEVDVRGGDRIWWDYRDWTAAMRVPAVVGSWPQPFASGPGGPGSDPVEVDCRTAPSVCGGVKARLRTEGAEIGSTGDAADGPRILVGPWVRVGDDPLAKTLDGGPSASGVFARFEAAHGAVTLDALDVSGDVARRLSGSAGLVAALRSGDDAPTWLVTGTDSAGVRDAAGLLGEQALGDRYAVAVDAGREQPLPVAD